MYAHTHIHIYTYISQHVDPPNINALCMGGGTRCIYNAFKPTIEILLSSNIDWILIPKVGIANSFRYKNS